MCGDKHPGPSIGRVKVLVLAMAPCIVGMTPDVECRLCSRRFTAATAHAIAPSYNELPCLTDVFSGTLCLPNDCTGRGVGEMGQLWIGAFSA